MKLADVLNEDKVTIKKIYGYAKMHNGAEYTFSGDESPDKITEFTEAVYAVGIKTIDEGNLGDEANNHVVLSNGKEVTLDSAAEANKFYSKY